MKKISFPVMSVKMIPIAKVEANNYNPNRVATPEMKLLKLSIEEDGYTQPIVVYYDSETDKYVLVDGYHRYRCAVEFFDLEEIPATIIDKNIDQRMASTIRHNRARGTHQIKNMSEIVSSLYRAGWGDVKIMMELGMEADEVIRLKQIIGLKENFSDHSFSKSWVEYATKREVTPVDQYNLWLDEDLEIFRYSDATHFLKQLSKDILIPCNIFCDCGFSIQARYLGIYNEEWVAVSVIFGAKENPNDQFYMTWRFNQENSIWEIAGFSNDTRLIRLAKLPEIMAGWHNPLVENIKYRTV